MIASEFHHQPPICCGTMNSTTHIPQHNSAVQGIKVDLTVDIRDRNPTVVGIQRQVGTLRHEHLVANIPLIVLISFRATGKDFSPTGLYSDLLCHGVCFLTRWCCCLYSSPHQYLILVPTLHCDPAILFAIYSH